MGICASIYRDLERRERYNHAKWRYLGELARSNEIKTHYCDKCHRRELFARPTDEYPSFPCLCDWIDPKRFE